MLVWRDCIFNKFSGEFLSRGRVHTLAHPTCPQHPPLLGEDPWPHLCNQSHACAFNSFAFPSWFYMPGKPPTLAHFQLPTCPHGAGGNTPPCSSAVSDAYTPTSPRVWNCPVFLLVPSSLVLPRSHLPRPVNINHLGNLVQGKF